MDMLSVLLSINIGKERNYILNEKHDNAANQVFNVLLKKLI